MALRRCLGCSTLFAVGLLRCPSCRSTEHVEEGNEAAMPKITKHGGATNAADGGQPWDGNSSSSSVNEPETTPEKTGSDDQSPAPTTGGRSGKGQTASSSARSTGGAKGKRGS